MKHLPISISFFAKLFVIAFFVHDYCYELTVWILKSIHIFDFGWMETHSSVCFVWWSINVVIISISIWFWTLPVIKIIFFANRIEKLITKITRWFYFLLLKYLYKTFQTKYNKYVQNSSYGYRMSNITVLNTHRNWQK